MNMLRWWPRGRQGPDRVAADPVSREKERALKLFGEPPAEEPHPYAIDPVVSVPVRPAGGAAPQLPAAHWRVSIIIIGILGGGIIGLLLFADDPKLLLVGPRKVLADVSGSTGYIDCAHVRLVGAAPLKKGDKGYSKRLDVDGDGIACEPLLSDEDATDTAKADTSKAGKDKRRKKD